MNYENVSKRNLKHISKHLAEFQKYDPAITLSDLVELGQNIAENPDNLINISQDKQIFEKEVIINKRELRVRVVLNPLGNLRSVHIRY